MDFVQRKILSYKKQMDSILEFSVHQIQRYQYACQDMRNKIIGNIKFFEQPKKTSEQLRKELTISSLEL